MEKLKSSLPNMVFVLTGVAIITGGLLAWVNSITAAPIAQQQKQELADGIKAVMQTTDLVVAQTDTVKQGQGEKTQDFVVYRVNDKAGESIGAAVEATTMGFGGDLRILAGFSPEGELLGYTILQHSETPGLGAKADKWFQAGQKGDIIGRQMDSDKPLTVKKDGGDVDAITASTITSRAFLSAINQAYAAYAAKPVDAQSGASKRK